ncbi:MAG: acyl dehydratase [Deltaproteobacteria bacterium]|jgi:acyl dehydratase|nr:acyl dehydratase [Deltaproteobacteria bacterium]
MTHATEGSNDEKRCFEDIEVGCELTSDGYTIEREEIIEFARRWDPYDFHLDEGAARDSLFGGIAACAAHVFAISSFLSHALPGGPLALVAGLGGDGLNLLAPVRPGARLRLVRRFIAARPSKSHPTAGVVTFEDTLVSTDGEALFRTTGSVLVERRD